MNYYSAEIFKIETMYKILCKYSDENDMNGMGFTQKLGQSHLLFIVIYVNV